MNELRGTRCLVTGGAGFVGSNIVDQLLDAGASEVRVVDNFSTGFRRNLDDCQDRIELIEGDLAELAVSKAAVQGMDYVLHQAAIPSVPRSVEDPITSHRANATATLNLLVAARDFAREAPFCFTSTNKVYGDRPNYLPLTELDKRYDYAGGLDGVDENMSIDQCLHSVFGASKVAADVMCQEFGRYFQMPVGVFRGGCLTGPQHAAVELHGYLAYIVHCAAAGKEYTIYGYKGKQVRDQIHSYDVAHLFLEFFRSPRCGEVYNLGGGRANSLSILETIDTLAGMGLKLRYSYKDTNRTGDHICYISDLSKLRAHFPNWKMQYDLPRILDEIAARHTRHADGPAGTRSQ